MARILICGTLAYDDIGVFDSALQPHTRNVKLSRLDRGFGGCAMNIAYNLAGLGHDAVPFVYAGDDYAGDYARHVVAAGISEAGIFRMSGTPSARGIVLTGSDGAQFTVFYPGPSGSNRWMADLESLLDGTRFDAAIVAPDLPEKMTGCARALSGQPLVVWCPGQYAESLSRTDLEPALDAAHLLVVNRHEWRALTAHLPASDLARRAGRLIITDGPGAVEVFPEGLEVPVPPLPTGAVRDPTGCGDAFVAALTAALLDGQGAGQAASAGIRLAGICISYRGAQNHPVTAAAEPSRQPPGHGH